MKTSLTVNYHKVKRGVTCETITHSYKEDWETSEYFCPSCGLQKVWENEAEGDYYIGSPYICTACGALFYLPTGTQERPNNDQHKQRLDHLRACSE